MTLVEAMRASQGRGARYPVNHVGHGATWLRIASPLVGDVQLISVALAMSDRWEPMPAGETVNIKIEWADATRPTKPTRHKKGGGR